jgi:uncharacterized OB-fold protein
MSAPAVPLLPDVTSPVTAPFWEGARAHRLVMQRCPGCAALRWPPKPLCPDCLRPGSPQDWREIADTGAIWSFAIYHRAFHPSLADQIPYNVAYVTLDAGPTVITNIVGADELRIGQRVKAVYEDMSPEVTLVRFRPE